MGGKSGVGGLEREGI